MTDSSSPPTALPGAVNPGLGAPEATTRPLVYTYHMDLKTVPYARLTHALARCRQRLVDFARKYREMPDD